MKTLSGSTSAPSRSRPDLVSLVVLLGAAVLLPSVPLGAQEPDPPRPADDAGALARGVVLEGVVFDSIRARPVPDAVISILELGRSAVTDRDGVYRFEAVPPGEYRLALSYPWLESLGFDLAPTGVRIAEADSVVRHGLVIPSLATLVADRCERTEQDRRATFALMGYVRDRGSSTPLPGAEVAVSTVTDREGDDDPALRPRVSTTAGADGLYLVCEVPLGATVDLSVSFFGQDGDPIRTTFRTPGAVQMDLTLPLQDEESDDAPAFSIRTRELDGAMGSGRVFGWLRDAETGEAVSDARVEIMDTEDHVALTDGRGRFTFAKVPPGRHVLQVEHLAYGTRASEFVLSSTVPSAVEVDIPTRAIELDPLEVTVRALTAREIAERRTGGRARVMLRGDIDRLAAAFHAGDIVRRLPGVTVTEGHAVTGQSLCIESSRGPATIFEATRAAQGCNQMPVFIDGMRVTAPEELLRSLPPNQVESIEVLDAATAGGYVPGIRTGAAIIVIYTRGNGPYAALRRDAGGGR